MRLPFGHHETEYTPDQVDQAYETRGWGVKVERRIPRAGGEPLYFQLRLPNQTVCTDIADLAADAQGAKETDEAGEANALFSQQTESLQALGEAPGVVLVGAVANEDRPTEPMHTLTALHTSLTELPKTFTLSEPQGWDVIRHEQTRVAKHVLRDLLVIARYPERGDDAQTLITQQYALATELGSLVVTFTNGKSASGRTLAYYDDVVKTVWLGETPATIVDPIT